MVFPSVYVCAIFLGVYFYALCHNVAHYATSASMRYQYAMLDMRETRTQLQLTTVSCGITHIHKKIMYNNGP